MQSVTDVARIELSCGGVDALHAVHFARRFPPHFHETFAIGVVESGAARIRTRGGQWTAKAGAILAFSPGEIHSAEPLGEHGYTYRMVYPTAEFMREAAGDTSRADGFSPLFAMPVIPDANVGREFVCAHRPLMDGIVSAAVESRLLASIGALVRRHGAGALLDAPTASTSNIAVVDRARAYLHGRLAQRVHVAELAEVCGMSEFQFIRVFRGIVGVPPHAYLVQLRVNRAQALLCQGARVSDVAYACGFSDQSHLTRTFKQAVGVPPGQYAQSVRSAA